MTADMSTVSQRGPVGHAVAQPSAPMVVYRRRVSPGVSGAAEISVGPDFRLIIPALSSLEWLLSELGRVAVEWRGALAALTAEQHLAVDPATAEPDTEEPDTEEPGVDDSGVDDSAADHPAGSVLAAAPPDAAAPDEASARFTAPVVLAAVADPAAPIYPDPTALHELAMAVQAARHG